MSQFAYKVGQAAVVAAIGRTALYAAIKSGDLRARKCGRATIILADDLRDFLRALPTARGQPQKSDNDPRPERAAR